MVWICYEFARLLEALQNLFLILCMPAVDLEGR